jgi:hypothetical protein
MSGGFLGRALGLGRALLLRGFGGGTGDAPVVTSQPGCMTLTVMPLASMSLTVTPLASMALTVMPLASMTLTVETC